MQVNYPLNMASVYVFLMDLCVRNLHEFEVHV